MKKIADCDIFDKFQHVTSELEKNMIANIPLKYAKKQLTQDREERYINTFTERPNSASNINLNCLPSLKLRSEKKANFRFAFKCVTFYKKKDSFMKKSGSYDFKKLLKSVNNAPMNNNVSYVGFSKEEFNKIKKSDSMKKKKERENDDNLIDLEFSKSSFATNNTNQKKDSFANKNYPQSNAPNLDLLNDDIIENKVYSRDSKIYNSPVNDLISTFHLFLKK